MTGSVIGGIGNSAAATPTPGSASIDSRFGQAGPVRRSGAAASRRHFRTAGRHLEGATATAATAAGPGGTWVPAGHGRRSTCRQSSRLVFALCRVSAGVGSSVVQVLRRGRRRRRSARARQFRRRRVGLTVARVPAVPGVLRVVVIAVRYRRCRVVRLRAFPGLSASVSGFRPRRRSGRRSSSVDRFSASGRSHPNAGVARTSECARTRRRPEPRRQRRTNSPEATMQAAAATRTREPTSSPPCQGVSRRLFRRSDNSRTTAVNGLLRI